ncbi:MAG TPA: phosphate acyltransferase PlsX [Bacillota bacterium]|nr:phosphate acyltransferase PlsX [Bacillota bacterium]
MKIAIDAMGGDHAPQAIVEGALKAAQSLPNVQILLVGDNEKIKHHIIGDCPNNIEIIHASEVIAADEKEPAKVIRRKKDSSMVIALEMVKDQRADAVISAGNTGAFMAGGIFIAKRMEGIERPALAPVLPTIGGSGVLVLDVGANMDAKPENLLQYAIMGNIYMKRVMDVDKPRVGLLNVGTEEKKGNELTKETFELLSSQAFEFVGNVEARDIPFNVCDVVVCDGFSGNILLKSFEGMAEVIFKVMKEEFMSSFRAKIGASILRPSFSRIRKKLDYMEYGGAPLMGLGRPCIKVHGSSNANAIRTAIFQAVRFVEEDVIGYISQEVKLEGRESNG